MCRVTDNLKLVRHIAWKYTGKSRLSHDELYQEGCIGLVMADKEYVEGKVPFSSFASQRIAHEILRAMEGANVLYTPRDIVGIAIKIKRAKKEEAPVEELMELTGAKKHLVERAIMYLELEMLSLEYEYERRSSDGKKKLTDYIKLENDFHLDLKYEELFERLGRSYTEVLKLQMQGYGIPEIAEIIGLDLAQARNRVNVARRNAKALRKLYV